MITFETIKENTIKILQENPDFQYIDFRMKQLGLPKENRVNAACAYLDEDNEPSCLFGRSLAASGVDMSIVAKLEGEGISEVLRQLKIPFTDKDDDWLTSCQYLQDNNEPYSSILEDA